MKPYDPLVTPIDPVTALTRIAWLLEVRRESSYRVEAFRKAAHAAAGIGADELARRSAARTLTDIKGIGKTTAAVIAAAVDGELPSYLAELQQTMPVPPAVGAELFRAIRGDLHAHTDWSDGGAPLPEMASAAIESGHEWLAITDHSPRLTVANGLSPERLRAQLSLVDELNSKAGNDFRILSGIEVDILDDGALDQADDLLDELDVVTASVHSKLRMESGPMTDRLVAAVSDPRVDVLGHCTGRRVVAGRGHRPPSTFNAAQVFRACAEHGTAVEINSRPERVDPPDELIELARDLGCLFAIDSDAHAPGQLEFKALGAERAERLGIDADRIVTTWPLHRLLEWSKG